MRRDDSSVVEPGVKGSMTGRYAYGLMVVGGWADEDRNGRGFLSGCIQSKRLLHNVTD